MSIRRSLQSPAAADELKNRVPRLSPQVDATMDDTSVYDDARFEAVEDHEIVPDHTRL